MRTVPEEVLQALRTARERCEEIKGRGDAGYALAYINHAMVIPRTEVEAMKTQILYILSNLQWWRGPEAREAKRVLKEFAN